MLRTSSSIDLSANVAQIVIDYNGDDNGGDHNGDFDRKFAF